MRNNRAESIGLWKIYIYMLVYIVYYIIVICDIEMLVENLLRGRVSTRCSDSYVHTSMYKHVYTRSLAYYVESQQLHVRTLCLLLSLSLSLFLCFSNSSFQSVRPSLLSSLRQMLAEKLVFGLVSNWLPRN